MIKFIIKELSISLISFKEVYQYVINMDSVFRRNANPTLKYLQIHKFSITLNAIFRTPMRTN